MSTSGREVDCSKQFERGSRSEAAGQQASATRIVGCLVRLVKFWAKSLMLVTLFAGVLLFLLTHSLQQSPSFSFNLKDLPSLTVRGGRKAADGAGNVKVVLHSAPKSDPDTGDSVGFKSLQGFDCATALQKGPPESPLGPRHAGLSDEEVRTNASRGNCAAFRQRFGYNRHGPATTEETAFPLAFNILLYKEVGQLHMLLRALYRPHNSYCLHVDGWAGSAVLEATRSLAQCLPGVFLASRRENITYSGFTRLQADINCMQDHWDRSQTATRPWRYLLNLPSQEFPLKTNLEMVRILTAYNGSNDVEGVTRRTYQSGRFRFKHVYKTLSNGRQKIVKTGDKHEDAPHGMHVVKGYAYGVFSREFVRYVLQSAPARDLLQWCRAVNSPDEYYWATLHHNPQLHVPGSYTGKPDAKPFLGVYASWGGSDCFSNIHKHGICIFGVKDLPQLTARKELMANKFFLDVQPAALHCLDHWLLNRTRQAPPFNLTYYQNLPFVHK